MIRKTSCLFLVLATLVIDFGCNVPTYHETMSKSYSSMLSKNYGDALSNLEKNKYLKEKHSTLLYQIEKGRLLFLQGEYKAAFDVLEEADKSMTEWKELKERDVAGYIATLSKTETSFGTISSSSKSKPLKEMFKSPRKTDYRPAPYERILIHYYKALALIMLRKTDEAGVEARQLDELSQSLDDLKSAESFVKSYVSDPMPQLLAGIIYELQGDINGAFVAYENALKKITAADAQTIYGSTVPTQLQNDLLSLSARLGFDDRLQYYEKLFGKKLEKQPTPKVQLIVLIDNGFVPFKKEDRSWYHSKYGTISTGRGGSKNSLLFSKPEFVPAPAQHETITWVTALSRKNPETIYDPYHITMQTMNRRYRIQTEQYLREAFKADTVSNSSSQYRRADTRNWQSIPKFIQYVKVDADTGWQNVYLGYQGNRTDTVRVYCRNKTQLHYVANWR